MEDYVAQYFSIFIKAFKVGPGGTLVGNFLKYFVIIEFCLL